jgi:hypothetical protein
LAALRRLDVLMPLYYHFTMANTTKRSTIYFDPAIHRALRLKSVEVDRSISDLVNDAVKGSLTEDAEDLIAFEERATEPNLSFEEVVKDLKRSGKI